MEISKQQYNSVVSGLRTQLELLREETREVRQAWMGTISKLAEATEAMEKMKVALAESHREYVVEQAAILEVARNGRGNSEGRVVSNAWVAVADLWDKAHPKRKR